MERSSLRELLRATRELEEKSRANETLAFNLLHLGEDLRQTVENMRTFRDTLMSVQGGDHHRHLPQIEEAYLQQLQRDNAELRSSLQEHKDALETIMSTYRQQVCALMNSVPSREDKSKGYEQELYLAQQRLFEMAHVMSEAANSTDQEVYQLHQRVSQLEFENKNLRELLYLADQSVLEPYIGKNGQEHVEKRKSEVEEEDPRLSLSSSRSSKSLTGSIPSPTNPDVFLSPHNSSTDGPFMKDGLLSSPIEDEVNISWPSSEDPPTPANQPSLQVPPHQEQDVSLALQQMDEIFQPWLDEELDGDSPNEDQGELLKDGSHGNIPPSFNCTVRSQTSNSKISPIAVEDIK